MTIVGRYKSKNIPVVLRSPFCSLQEIKPHTVIPAKAHRRQPKAGRFSVIFPVTQPSNMLNEMNVFRNVLGNACRLMTHLTPA
jgi:hypothetical protein